MSATIGIQTITPTTGTAPGQAQWQADDNAAKTSAKAVVSDISVDAVTQPKQSETPPATQTTAHQVDVTA